LRPHSRRRTSGSQRQNACRCDAVSQTCADARAESELRRAVGGCRSVAYQARVATCAEKLNVTLSFTICLREKLTIAR
jgi:hypothetical protein